MQAFEFYSPTKILFGPKTEHMVGQQILELHGSRVTILYGSGHAVAAGLLERVIASIQDAGLEYLTLGGVHPNPYVEFAQECICKSLSFHTDFVLAIGGGSVIDTAKAVAAGIANPNTDLWDLWTRKATLTASTPIGVILTIPASGSESSSSAVLTHKQTGIKRGLSSELHRPRFAILNPELCASLSRRQIACGVVDILMHTMDRYFNPVTTNELTDEIAEGLMRTTIRNGRIALTTGADYQSMSELMWAGTLSHNDLTGLGGKKDFAPHQLGHELSAKFNCVHGETLSAIWESWACYVVAKNPKRFAQFGKNVWGIQPKSTDLDTAYEAIRVTNMFFRSLNMPTSLGELPNCGVLEDSVITDMSIRCTYYNERTIGTFQVLHQEDIKAIFQLANH